MVGRGIFELFCFSMVVTVRVGTLAWNIQRESSPNLHFPELSYDRSIQGMFLFRNKFLTVENGQVIVTPCDGNSDQLIFDMSVYMHNVPKRPMIVLLRHTASGTYLFMTDDGRLATKAVGDVRASNINSSQVEYYHRKISRADNRFFYYQSSGVGESYDALEAMNGNENFQNRFLSVSDDGSATLSVIKSISVQFTFRTLSKYPECETRNPKSHIPNMNPQKPNSINIGLFASNRCICRAVLPVFFVYRLCKFFCYIQEK